MKSGDPNTVDIVFEDTTKNVDPEYPGVFKQVHRAEEVVAKKV